MIFYGLILLMQFFLLTFEVRLFRRVLVHLPVCELAYMHDWLFWESSSLLFARMQEQPSVDIYRSQHRSLHDGRATVADFSFVWIPNIFVIVNHSHHVLIPLSDPDPTELFDPV